MKNSTPCSRAATVELNFGTDIVISVTLFNYHFSKKAGYIMYHQDVLQLLALSINQLIPELANGRMLAANCVVHGTGRTQWYPSDSNLRHQQNKCDKPTVGLNCKTRTRSSTHLITPVDTRSRTTHISHHSSAFRSCRCQLWWQRYLVLRCWYRYRHACNIPCRSIRRDN
jgi:hypothetical protein